MTQHFALFMKKTLSIVSIVRVSGVDRENRRRCWLSLKSHQKILDGDPGDVSMKQSYQIQTIIRRLGMKFEHTLGCGDASMGEILL